MEPGYRLSSYNETHETPLWGPCFEIDDKVRFVSPSYYGYDNIKAYPEFEGLDIVNGTFTIDSIEIRHYFGIGDHDDAPDHDYQSVSLAEIPGWRFSSDKLDFLMPHSEE